MNLFKIVKESVTVKQAAALYGLPVTSTWMVRCPFHEDHTPSMKLNDTYYYCFGCGATGDVIDLTAQLFGLSSFQAARKLAQDFGLSPDKPPSGAVALPKPPSLPSDAQQEEIFYCLRVLHDYRYLLIRWQTEFAPLSTEEPLDDRFVEALHIPPRIFKEMTHLTQQRQKLDQLLTGIGPLNSKKRAAEISELLDGYIPAVEKMRTQLKKYSTAFTSTKAENEKLKKKNKKLSESLEEANYESVLKKLEDAKLQREYQEALAVLERIPPEVLEEYAKPKASRRTAEL
ncbi:hypothetical protein B5G28_05600 [Faecalibacterium sp. An77]|uniref:CHC2 zinc finger domain-containing protein n=1 Tax=Faecalibacterium sp. An77 TaxID=1965655 RepID=UPI000B37656A|nr:CHC2 zinc finger domain-containing protein [Faecalibacterium sp. An77]OUN39310.1 hypothetical protein B5G28_05600 [Faecalibacterium sp. An77]